MTANPQVETKEDDGIFAWMVFCIISFLAGIIFSILIPFTGFIIISFILILNILRIVKHQPVILKRFKFEFFSLYFSIMSLFILIGHMQIIALDLNLIYQVLHFQIQSIIILISIFIGFGNFVLEEVIDSKNIV